MCVRTRRDRRCCTRWLHAKIRVCRSNGIGIKKKWPVRGHREGRGSMQVQFFCDEFHVAESSTSLAKRNLPLVFGEIPFNRVTLYYDAL